MGRGRIEKLLATGVDGKWPAPVFGRSCCGNRVATHFGGSILGKGDQFRIYLGFRSIEGTNFMFHHGRYGPELGTRLQDLFVLVDEFDPFSHWRKLYPCT